MNWRVPIFRKCAACNSQNAPATATSPTPRKARATKLELGAATATDLMRDMNDEQAARLEKAYHELQLLQTIYNLKYTRNQ